ncbi:MAG: hypothetical protein M5U33_07275 [Pseudorhodoplanes sp.]|nr:hypothetical protein [Pseudorhodoplanes sp.]
MRAPRDVLIAALVAAGFGLTLYVFHPGVMTYDAKYVYEAIFAPQPGDWQSPLMVTVWRWIDPLAPGAASMFLLDRHALLVGLCHPRFQSGAPQPAGRDPAAGRSGAAAGLHAGRHHLARRAVRSRLDSGGGAGLGRRGSQQGRARGASRSRRWRSSLSACCCGRTRCSRRPFWRSMPCGRKPFA